MTSLTLYIDVITNYLLLVLVIMDCDCSRGKSVEVFDGEQQAAALDHPPGRAHQDAEGTARVSSTGQLGDSTYVI